MKWKIWIVVQAASINVILRKLNQYRTCVSQFPKQLKFLMSAILL